MGRINTIISQEQYIKDLEKKYKKLQKEFEQYKEESISWSAEDFITRAKQTGYRISKERAQEALERMIYKHDAELGISWTTVDCYLEEYGTPVKRKKKPEPDWDECTCKDCGFTWNASEDEHFNITFCSNCHSTNIGGEYWRKEKKK